MAIVNKQMGDIFAEIAKELIACENVSPSSRIGLQDVIDNPSYSYGSFSIDFVKENNNWYTSKCTLNLKFSCVDGEYSETKEDEFGNKYRDYSLEVKISLGALLDVDLRSVQSRIDFMNEVVNIALRVSKPYENDVIRHIHTYLLKKPISY